MTENNRDAQFKKMILIGTALLVCVGGPLLIKPIERLKGKGLNSRAWRASYTERKLALPPGPREGWWGVHLSPVQDKELGYRLPERHVPGVFEIDQQGVQTVVSRKPPKAHILIIGGSVAAGAYTSNLGRVYFSQLARRLELAGLPVKISVLAAGAWMSMSELQAFRVRGITLKPDYVIFLSGLNDLLLRKDLPEEERIREFLGNMKQARDLADKNNIHAVFSLQPVLVGKKNKSNLEWLILGETYPRVERLSMLCQKMREGLQSLSRPGQAFYVDASHAFDEESKTTFADIWHFSDIGQSLLAESLFKGLEPILTASLKGKRAPVPLASL